MIEKSIGSIQSKERKYQFHSALYAYYFLTGNYDAAEEEARKGAAVIKELADMTGHKKYKFLVWAGDGAMFVPDRKKKSYFGVIRR